MIEIIPAIMPQSYSDLEEKMRQVSSLSDFVQIDIMDGVFTPSRSWPYPLSNNPEFEEIKDGKKDMPFLNDLEFEVDLMVSEPQIDSEDWIKSGARRVIVHFASTKNILGVIEQIRKSSPDVSSPLAIECGLAVSAETDFDDISSLVSSVDFVQCMGISKIGYQGQPFDDKILSLISRLRNRYPELIISVDGGVSLETAPELIRLGVNRLVVGSAIFQSDNIEETIQSFQSL